jgi:hypothetical protein
VWVGLYVGVGGLPFVPYELFEPSTCMACAPYALFTVSHSPLFIRHHHGVRLCANNTNTGELWGVCQQGDRLQCPLPCHLTVPRQGEAPDRRRCVRACVYVVEPSR